MCGFWDTFANVFSFKKSPIFGNLKPYDINVMSTMHNQSGFVGHFFVFSHFDDFLIRIFTQKSLYKHLRLLYNDHAASVNPKTGAVGFAPRQITSHCTNSSLCLRSFNLMESTRICSHGLCFFFFTIPENRASVLSAAFGPLPPESYCPRISLIEWGSFFD